MSKEGNRDFKVSYSSFWVEVEDKKKKNVIKRSAISTGKLCRF